MIVENLADTLAEQSLLGSIVLGTSDFAGIRENLAAEDFAELPHARLYRLCEELSDGGVAINTVSIRDLSLRNGHGVQPDLLEVVARAAASGGDAAHNASIVKELARRRRIRSIGEEIALRAKDRSVEPGSVLSDAAEYLRELSATDTARILPGRTLAQIMSQPRPPREWHIPGLLRKGKTCIVFGSSFSGKSFLFWQYALQAALGEADFIGFRLPGTPSRVAIYIGENDEDEVAEHMTPQLGAAPPPDNLVVRDVLGTKGSAALRTQRGMNWLRDTILADQSSVVILDNLMSLVGGDLKDSETAVFVMDGLKRISKETGVSFLVIAHPRKAGQQGDEASVADQLYGAHEWFSYSDAAIHIAFPDKNSPRDETKRHVNIPKVRGVGGKIRKPFVIEYDHDAHKAVYVADLGNTAGTKTPLDAIQALRDAGIPLDAEALAAALGVSRKTLDRRILSSDTWAEWCREGAVTATTGPKGAKTYEA